MAEKRQRGEETREMEEGEISKRCKPYDHILSILEEEEEEDEPNTAQQVEAEFDMFITLQQELSSSSSSSSSSEVEAHRQVTGPPVSPAPSSTEDDDRIDVMRHLLEASDDELGIPNLADGGYNGDENGTDGQDFPFSLCDDGLWEFEDQSAYYYSLLQSELFM